MSKYNKIIESGLIFLLIFTPLAFGTVHTWSITIMELIVLFLFLVWIFKILFGASNAEVITKNPKELSNSFSFRNNLLLLSIILFLILLLFQLIPLPPDILKIVSPETYKIYSEYLPYEWPAQLSNPSSRDLFSQWKTLSIYPYATKTGLFKVLVYSIIFLLITSTISTKKQIKRFIKTIIFMSFLLALFGIIQKLTWNGGIYWFWKPEYGGDSFGPYVNKNHFAGYMIMVIPLTIGFLIFKLNEYSSASSDSSFSKRIAENEKVIAKTGLLIFFIIIIISALFLTLSRGGIMSFLVSMVFLGIGLTIMRRGRKKLWIGLMLALLLIISLDWFGMEPIAKRLGSLQQITREEPHNPRLEIWKDTLRISRDFPILGTGFNTFSHIFPKYKNLDRQLKFIYTENDYLQLLSETGLIGLAIALSFLVIFFIKTIKTWYGRHDIYVKSLVLGGLTSLVAILIHSLTDFNLHIPANALLFTIILALTYNLVNLKRTVKNKKSNTI